MRERTRVRSANRPPKREKARRMSSSPSFPPPSSLYEWVGRWVGGWVGGLNLHSFSSSYTWLREERVGGWVGGWVGRWVNRDLPKVLPRLLHAQITHSHPPPNPFPTHSSSFRPPPPPQPPTHPPTHPPTYLRYCHASSMLKSPTGSTPPLLAHAASSCIFPNPPPFPHTKREVKPTFPLPPTSFWRERRWVGERRSRPSKIMMGCLPGWVGGWVVVGGWFE